MYSGLVCFEFERNTCVFSTGENLNLHQAVFFWGGGVMRWCSGARILWFVWFWLHIPLDIPARNRVTGK